MRRTTLHLVSALAVISISNIESTKASLPWEIEKEWHDATTAAHKCYQSHATKIKPEDCANCRELNAREAAAARKMDELKKQRDKK